MIKNLARHSSHPSLDATLRAATAVHIGCPAQDMKLPAITPVCVFFLLLLYCSGIVAHEEEPEEAETATSLIHATGGGNERTGGKHHAPSFMMDELQAIVETAHSLDLKVTAHAAAGINAALRAGVDGIEHGSFLDDESIRLFNGSGAYLVPTLDVQDMIAARMDSMPEHRQKRMKLFQEEHPANFLRAYRAGVNVAMGSDAGVVPHGSSAREVEWLVKAGVSAAEALRIATLGSADHLGLTETTGKLAAGMEADVIAVEGNPLEDITALQEVVFVMKDGAVHKFTD